MAVFPVLEIEKEVQIGDKTRLEAVKSFISTGNDPIANVSVDLDGQTITLSPLGSPTPEVTTFDTWFTDWIWSTYAFEVDTTSNKIDFEEAGVSYVAAVASSSYASVALLAAAIQTALNLAGATGVFTVTVDENFKIMISSTVPFSILIDGALNKMSGLLTHLGFGDVDTENLASHVGLPVEYGRRKITLSCDDDTNPPVTVDLYQHVYTEYGDRLFCTDDDLKKHEEDIHKWVIPGRSSHKDVIRRVQKLIFEYLAGQGEISANLKKFNKWDFIDLKEVRDWAVYWTLQLIFEGNSNAVDDIFDKKAKKYSSSMLAARTRYLSIDIDGDGKVEFDEELRLNTINLFRR